MKIFLKDLPMPPTANRQMIPVRGRLVKSNSARIFDQQVDYYILRNFRSIDVVKDQIKRILEDGFLLQIELFFRFPHSQLFTKKNNSIKRKDTDNRVKSATDAVSKIIGVDDSLFIKTISERVIQCKLYGGVESIDVRLSQFSAIRNCAEILANPTL